MGFISLDLFHSVSLSLNQRAKMKKFNDLMLKSKAKCISKAEMQKIKKLLERSNEIL